MSRRLSSDFGTALSLVSANLLILGQDGLIHVKLSSRVFGQAVKVGIACGGPLWRKHRAARQ